MEEKLIKKIPLKHLSVMDPNERYQLLEAGKSQSLLDYETTEVTHLIDKKMIQPLWIDSDIYYRSESSTTYCLDLNSMELLKSKRYECDINSSKLIQTKSYIVRYDVFTHNIMLWDKKSQEYHVKVMPLKKRQRVLDMIPIDSDVCLTEIINDPEDDRGRSYYVFKTLNVRTLEFTSLPINKELQDIIAHEIIYGIYYLRSSKMWALFIGKICNLLVLNHDLTEIVYKFEAEKEGIDIHACLSRYIEPKDILLFEGCKKGISYLEAQFIYALDLKTMQCRKWVTLDQYSPFYYNTKYGYLIIESTRKYRGLVEIYQVEL